MITRVRIWISVAAAFLVAVAVSWLSGRREGRASAASRAAAQREKAASTAREIENEIEALDKDTLRRRASVWVRGTKR